VANLAPGSTFATTFILPLEMANPKVHTGLELAARGPDASGTPFISFYTPAEMLTLALQAGITEARHVPASLVARPPDNAEELLVATI
jgi:hypothetical protein